MHLKNWAKLLAIQAGRPLESFERVIMGSTNSCSPPVKTTYVAETNLYLDKRNGGIGCEYPDGPPFAEFANTFTQPLLFMTKFAEYSLEQDQQLVNDLQAHVQNRTNELVHLDARKYIKRMGGEGVWECGSLSTKYAYDCVNNATAQQNLHRCTGDKGAHPDLVAWDLVEFMHSKVPIVGDYGPRRGESLESLIGWMIRKDDEIETGRNSSGINSNKSSP